MILIRRLFQIYFSNGWDMRMLKVTFCIHQIGHRKSFTHRRVIKRRDASNKKEYYVTDCPVNATEDEFAFP